MNSTQVNEYIRDNYRSMSDGELAAAISSMGFSINQEAVRKRRKPTSESRRNSTRNSPRPIEEVGRPIGGKTNGTRKSSSFVESWWPKKDYRTPIERRYRNLPCNIVWIDETAHTLLHIYTKPPDKPSHEEMCKAIWRHDQGFCSCGS